MIGCREFDAEAEVGIDTIIHRNSTFHPAARCACGRNPLMFWMIMSQTQINGIPSLFFWRHYADGFNLPVQAKELSL